VLKKLFTVAMTLTLLVGCYFVYVSVFDVVVERFKAIHSAETLAFPVHDSESKLEAMAIARAGFGGNHWSASEHRVYCYYNAERGFWMYAKEVERIIEEDGVKYDGKRLRMQPFALVWKSRDGKETKTITSDVAVFDLNEPLGLNTTPNGESLKIRHARVERNVLIRDDRGTPNDPGDDMHIGPLTTVDYDEPTQVIDSPSDTVIHDREMRVTGTGLEIKLRPGGAMPGHTSDGFRGAEYAILRKNVHVEMRDAGKSGIFPSSAQTHRSSSPTADVQAQATTGSKPQGVATSQLQEPTPLDVKCDGLMRVDLPPPVAPVAVGPPAPPLPTFVRFERNVVVLRGQLDDGPDELTSDTLLLTMVPEESAKPGPNQPTHHTTASTATAQPDTKAQGHQEKLTSSAAQQNAAAIVRTDATPSSAPDALAHESKDTGLFGDLTLRRTLATGHAVWLYLPNQGVKIRCNFLKYTRYAPFKADETYMCGDATRPLEIWKQDSIQDEEDPDFGKVTSATYIKTFDATIFDSGVGLDAADVDARGPGWLETRPDQNGPVERVAIWQDKLTIRNKLGPDQQVQQKVIDLTGNRPCFIDKLQDTSLDSAFWLRVWLKPKPVQQVATNTASASTPKAAFTATATTGQTATNGSQPGTKLATSDRANADAHPSQGFQIERLLALRDAHLIAPSRTMTARQRLDAEFVEAPPLSPTTQPVPQAQSGHAENNVETQGTATEANQTENQAIQQGETTELPPEQDQPQAQTADPPIVGSAERIWAKIALAPEDPSGAGAAKSKQAEETALAQHGVKRPGAAQNPFGSNAEVRNIWMWGSVAVHQDPAEGRMQGQDATGEALYLENRGKDKTLTYIYRRDPTEDPPRPGPLPYASASTEDRSIMGNLIRIDQATDRVWVDGPGMSTQLTDRGFLSDKAPEDESEVEQATDKRQDAVTSQPGATTSPTHVRETGLLATTETTDSSTATPSQAPVAELKPAIRAGRPLSPKVPLTITWTRNMEFMGRTVDPEGNPAAKAIFYGIVYALVEDGLLYCEDHMITYTDKEVPLAQVGKMMKPGSNTKDTQASSAEDASETKPELTLVECYGNAVAMNRKVYPDKPVELQRQRLEAECLTYDRRTGKFDVPVKGVVYLYDREEKSQESSDVQEDGGAKSAAPPSSIAESAPTRRTVTPTTGRTTNRSKKPSGANSSRPSSTHSSQPATNAAERENDEIPPLVLTQVRFATAMRGRFGTGRENDTTDTRWAEFFGDVQSARARVDTLRSELDEDRLPPDGFFLTGQVMRVITEPPPPGAPEETPARKFVKVWDKAAARNSDTVISADIVTYDSGKDLIYAHDEQGRGVSFAQQHAVGQPAAVGRARAVQLNPKTGALNLVDSERIQMIDKRTGQRPERAKPTDPNAKPPKKAKQPFKLPSSSMERRGFTGQ
jgi:hypothetical protein